MEVLPAIPQDTTDRNRTSPMAFTGNKFEFRMLGSSQSIAGPNIALNTIMAEELKQFADELEKSTDFNSDLQKLIKRVFTEHQRIIFSGNNYDEAWLAEAERRGLPNLASTADALPMYNTQKNVDLFVRHGIYTKEELTARAEIHIENYIKVISIEANTMVDMIRHEILPAVSAFSSDLCSRADRKTALGASCRYETTTAVEVSNLTDELMTLCEQLECHLAGIPAEPTTAMAYSHDVLLADMEAARTIADKLEGVTAKEYWPFPVYADLLFSV